MPDLSWTVGLSDGRVARIVSTRGRDFAVPSAGESESPGLLRRRAEIVDRPWAWFRQVHGTRVERVTDPGDGAGTEADGGYTTETGSPISVTTADCAPVVLVSTNGIAVFYYNDAILRDMILRRDEAITTPSPLHNA